MRKIPSILLAKYVLTLVIGLAIGSHFPGRVAAEDFIDLRRQVASILVLPFMETLVLQFAVIELVLLAVKREAVGLWIGAAISAAVFFWLHYAMNGPFNGYAFGLVGGVAYALIYVLERGRGRKNAFVAAWLLHAASNLLVLLSFAFFHRVMAV